MAAEIRQAFEHAKGVGSAPGGDQRTPKEQPRLRVLRTFGQASLERRDGVLRAASGKAGGAEVANVLGPGTDGNGTLQKSDSSCCMARPDGSHGAELQRVRVRRI